MHTPAFCYGAAPPPLRMTANHGHGHEPRRVELHPELVGGVPLWLFVSGAGLVRRLLPVPSLPSPPPPPQHPQREQEEKEAEEFGDAVSTSLPRDEADGRRRLFAALCVAQTRAAAAKRTARSAQAQRDAARQDVVKVAVLLALLGVLVLDNAPSLLARLGVKL